MDRDETSENDLEISLDGDHFIDRDIDLSVGTYGDAKNLILPLKYADSF